MWFALYHNFGRSFIIYMSEHCNNVNVNEDLAFGLFDYALSTVVVT
jgi:hypothetical protein